MRSEDITSLFYCTQRRIMLKFYDIDKNYINFLKTLDRQVPNIEYTSNNKFVCGIVLEVNEVKYYAPISHKTEKQQTNLQIFDNEKPISTIRFSFMVPAYSEVLKVKDFQDIAKTDSDYAALLRAEYSYCSSHIKNIQDKALAVYKIGCNKTHRLNYTCCDFKKLENEYMKYDKTKIYPKV